MIDWTKPIRYVSGTQCRHSRWCHVEKVECVSKEQLQATIRCSCGRIWMFSSAGLCIEKHGSPRIENIPPSEHWINIYWAPKEKTTETSCFYKSEEQAYTAAKLSMSTWRKAEKYQYLGTFKLED